MGIRENMVNQSARKLLVVCFSLEIQEGSAKREFTTHEEGLGRDKGAARVPLVEP